MSKHSNDGDETIAQREAARLRGQARRVTDQGGTMCVSCYTAPATTTQDGDALCASCAH